MSASDARQRIHPYVTRETSQRLSSYAAATHTTVSALVEAALRQYLDGTSDHTVLMRRIDRGTRQLERLHRDLHMLTEAFAIWVRLWYAYIPEVPDEAKPRAQRESARRYHSFVQTVARRLGHGKSLFDDLGMDPLGDDEELENAARGAQGAHIADPDAVAIGGAT